VALGLQQFKKDEGSTLVEYAVVFIMLTTMVFGITRPSPKTATDSSMAMSPQAFCALCWSGPR